MGLVPEPRIDRNGKTVIRHVRGSTGQPAAKRTVPAPQVFSKESQQLAEYLGMELAYFGLNGSRISLAEVMQHARRVPAETAAAILETQRRVKKGGAFPHVLLNALMRQDDSERLENIAYLYSDDQYEPFFVEEGRNETYRIISEDINGLAYYPQLNGATNFYRADRETQKKALALMALMVEADRNELIKIKTVEDTGKRAAVVKDDKLVALALRHADNIRELTDLIHERGTNVEMLEEALATTAPLRGGTL